MLENDKDEKRIPSDILETGEAESAFRSHANHLKLEKNRKEYVFYVLVIMLHSFNVIKLYTS